MTGENNRRCASIAMPPGTAARVPNEQARDVRLHRGGGKSSRAVSTGQQPIPRSKKEKPAMLYAAANRRGANKQPSRIRLPIRLVMTNGTARGADTLTKKCWRPYRRRDGRHYEPADFGMKRNRRVGGIGLAESNAP